MTTSLHQAWRTIKEDYVRAKSGLLLLARGDFRQAYRRLRNRLSLPARLRLAAAERCILENKTIKSWGIITPPHTKYIAHLIAERLRHHGWISEITCAAPDNFSHDLYIVLCPQVFNRLPPAEKRIVYQLEQSVSSRWFSRAYLTTLRSSLAVLEYSLSNLPFLASKRVSFPLVHYLPIGTSCSYGTNGEASEDKTHDVLFYGDSLSSPRRRRMLAALRERFNLREENDLFGDEMLRAIKQAKIVINLHYYENALLEMPRIQECLSLGVPVVSEASSDQGDYPELGASVTFFEPGSIPAMLDAVQKALQSESASAVAHSQAASQQRFAFMFDRFLVASGLLSSSYASSISSNLPVSAHTVALSMPESFNRRSAFVKVQPQGCVLFDGVRRTPGWIGCGLSYKTLALRSLALGHTSLTIMEDDVVLPSDYSQRLAIIHEFLESHDHEWDVFSGLIASLHPDTEVLNVENFRGYTFVTLNKMTSMVFNIYRRPALEMLAAWDPENRDVRTNTIDRWLESRPALRVVVMLPYLVDHREEAQSTLWHFDNSCYTNMISRSQGQLRAKVAQFQQQQIDR